MTRRQTEFEPDGTASIGYTALTDTERAAMDAGIYYAREHDVGHTPGETYCSAVEEARSAVLFRILGSLAREDPTGIPTPVVVETDEPTVPEELRTGIIPADISGRVLEQFDTQQALLFPFPANETVLAAPLEEVRGFDRFRFGDQSLQVDGTSVAAVGSPESVIEFVADEGFFPTATAASHARKQVGDSVANTALGLLARRVLWDRFDGTPIPAETDCPTELFDRLVVSGHPLHPGSKTRQGMSPVAGFGAAPEFTASIDVRFVAVRSDHVRGESVDDQTVSDHLYGQFPGLRQAVDEVVPGECDEYTVLAVHPWQLRTVIADRYAAARSKGIIVPVAGYSQPVAPLLSLRTVSTQPTAADGAQHLKLALDVQTTSSVRTLSPQAALTGPRVTGLLETVCDRESFDSFGVIPELAAACYHPPDGPHVDGEGYDDARNLATLVRRDPSTHHLVDDGEAVITAASLLSRPPNGDQSVLSALLETIDDQEPARAFLRAYLAVVIPGPLRLLVTHGVGFEAHLQNTSVVFDGGRPTAALMGDFGAVRLHEERTPERVRCYPDSEVYTSDMSVVRRELWNTLFQHHLGEIIGRLSATTELTAEECWVMVRDTCEQVFERLAADDRTPTSWVQADRSSLFDRRLEHISMTETWFKDADDYCLTTVPNPLSE